MTTPEPPKPTSPTPPVPDAPDAPGATDAPPANPSGILEAINDFDSSIPDEVVQHYLNMAGIQSPDKRLQRLIAVAAQKFIYDIVSDSLQHCKLRGAQGKKTKEKKYTLTTDDLAAALAEYGIEVKRQPYFN